MFGNASASFSLIFVIVRLFDIGSKYGIFFRKTIFPMTVVHRSIFIVGVPRRVSRRQCVLLLRTACIYAILFTFLHFFYKRFFYYIDYLVHQKRRGIIFLRVNSITRFRRVRVLYSTTAPTYGS